MLGVKTKKISKNKLIKILKTKYNNEEYICVIPNKKISHKEWLQGYWRWRLKKEKK
jgi:N-acetyl-gamma-glutamylphosphate reductase